MIAQFAKKISFFFIQKKIISDCDVEIYSYSFEMLLATLINLAAVITIAIIFNKIPETLIYLAAFLPLRIIAGGYHADTHFRCILILIITYLLVLFLLSTIPDNFRVFIEFISIVISLITIFLLAPVETINNPMTKEQKVKLKYKSRIVIIFYFITITVLIFINSYVALILAFGTLSVGLALVASKIKVILKVNTAENVLK